MPGRITAVYVREGQLVQAGQVLATAASLDESSATGESRALLASSQQHLFQTEISHTAVGEARMEAEGAARRNSLALEQRQRLSFAAPFAGTIVSASPESLVNQTTGAGEPLLTIADTASLKARVFLPEPKMAHIHPGDEVIFEVPASFRHFRTTLGSTDGPATELPAGVIESQQFSGTKLASFYTGVVPLGGIDEGGDRNARADLRLGMSGRAKVFGIRRSLLSRILTVAANLLRTHFW